MRLVAGREEFKFSDRLKLGLEFESQVERVFSNRGLQIYRYGLGTLPNSASQKIRNLNDPTSLLLRFTPDFYCPIPDRLTFFIECKSKKIDSPNYSYNLDSYNAGVKLSKMGIKILVVFSGLEAQWIEKLPIFKCYSDTSTLKLVNGSQKPFILIPKAQLFNLDSVLQELKG